MDEAKNVDITTLAQKTSFHHHFISQRQNFFWKASKNEYSQENVLFYFSFIRIPLFL